MKSFQRIYKKIEPTPDCWIWRGHKTVNGYGRVHWRGRSRPATHAVFELWYGPLPDWAFVCHTCDNPECVNPEHLMVGDHQDNMDDMDFKGRRFRKDYNELSRQGKWLRDRA